MKRVCLYPGSFDPLTRGHLDIIQRSAALFDRVVVAVLVNPRKTPMFTPQRRVDMIEKCVAALPNVSALAYEGGLLRCAQEAGAGFIARGIRSAADLEFESGWAMINRAEKPQTDTVFFISAPQYAHISSSHVREAGALGYDIAGMVPEAIYDDVMDEFRRRAK